MEHPPSFDDGRPPFDHYFARGLIGKIVLVGVTYLNHNGKAIEQRQFHGRVEDADARRGIRLRLLGERAGEDYWLPPDTRNFEKARPGEYCLRSTGEVVEDPDYLSTWTVTSPENNER